MANWSDPRPGLAPVGAAVDARCVAYDAWLRAYMLSVYNYMASAVLLTGIVAMVVAYSGAYVALISPPGGLSGLGWLAMLSPLALVFAMRFGQQQMSTGTLQALVWASAGLLGVVISVLGVLIFAGLTAWDTQRTKSIYNVCAGTENEGRAKIMSALNLYLDFINMFLFILRLFGSSRN